MLTNKLLATIKPGAVLWDDQVNGLHVKCTATGKKGFFFYYRVKGTKIERRPKLGDFGVLSLEQARKEALKMASAVASGADPAAQRVATRLEPDMRHLCAKYLWEYVRRKKKPKGRREDRRMIRQYVVPNFGKRKVKSLEYGDITDLHAKLRAKPIAANRLIALLSKMFNLAERWHFRPQHTNPCLHVEKYPEVKRGIVLTPDEAPEVAKVLAKYEATRPGAVLFIYLLILSGARPDEIRRAAPHMVEPRDIGGVLRLKIHKTDGTGKDRLVYLPPQIMTLISKVPMTADSLTGVKYPQKTWETVRREAKVPHLRMYDLRHSFASYALKLGYSLDQIGELLGHSSAQTTKRYTHVIDSAAQEAAAETASAIERMLKPEPVESGGAMSNTLAIGTK